MLRSLIIAGGRDRRVPLAQVHDLVGQASIVTTER
jgi:hypothetical protein